MGSTKSYRGGANFQKANTPGQKADASMTYSKGSKTTAEGTLMSGAGYGRSGHGGRSKSSTSKSRVKNAGPYGKS